MTTNQITDPEVLAELADIRHRYNLACYHLRQAANQLLTISKEYGLTYGEDTEDAAGLIKKAHEQVAYDREYFIEFLEAMAE